MMPDIKRIVLFACIATFSLNLLAFAQETESNDELFENKEIVLQSDNTSKRKIKAVYEDFENYTGGTGNLKIYLSLNKAAAEKSENELLDGNSICLNFSDVDFTTTTTAEPFLYYTYNTTEEFSWKSDLCCDGAVGGGGFVVVAKNLQGANVYLQNARFSKGDLVLYDYKTEKKRITLESNKKYSLEYTINPTEKTFDFYVNDEIVADDYKLEADFASINQLRMIASGSADYHENVYIDNFTIYKYTTEENITPEITWDAVEEIDLNVVNELTVNASDKDGEIVKIEFYCDEELINEKNSSTAIFDISSLPKGEHIIKAIAYDNENATAQLEKTIKFVRNEIELISVRTNLENDEYDISRLDDIEITAEGNTEELKKVSLYVDNVLIETNSDFKFSKEIIPTGKHEIKIVVFDAALNKGTWKKTITFTESGSDVWFKNDFSGYTGGNAVSGLTFNVTSGLIYNVRAKEIKPQYGNSMYFTVDEENMKNETTDIALWYSANTDKTLKWKASMFFETMPTNVHFQTVGPNSSGSNVYMSNVIIKNGEVTVGGKNVKTLETDRFYDFEYLLDMENRTYTFTVNGETVANCMDFPSNDITSINTLRLVTSYNKGKNIAFGVDNIEVGAVLQMPYIVNADYFDGKTILMEMTNAECTEKTDISVYDMSGKFEIEEIKKEENLIYLTMKNELKNDSVYTVSVIPSVLVGSAKQYGQSASYSFKSPQGEYGVSEVNFGMQDRKLSAEFTLYNNTNTRRQALIVCNISKEDKIMETIVKSVTLDKNSQNVFELSTSIIYDNSFFVKAFVLNSWQDRRAFCNNLFTY